MRTQAEQTREALNLTRTTLQLSNRPRLRVHPVVVNGFDDKTGKIATASLTGGKVWITNVGALPATVHHFHAEWLFTTTLPLQNPALTTIDRSTEPTEIRPGFVGQRSLPDFVVDFPVHAGINNAVEAASFGQKLQNGGTLFVVGYVKYSDSIGLMRHYFAFAYDPVDHYFKPVDHPNYSYEA